MLGGEEKRQPNHLQIHVEHNVFYTVFARVIYKVLYMCVLFAEIAVADYFKV